VSNVNDEAEWSATRLITDGDQPSGLVRSRCKLEVVRGPDAGQSVEVDQERIRVGTGPLNDLVLEDRTVSRVHAEIELSERGYRLRDLGSRNGLWVGGLRVSDCYLRPGTMLGIGKNEVAFHVLGEGAQIAIAPEASFGRLIGQSVPMRSLFATLRRVAQSNTTVLITGESGTGKDLAAEAIVLEGARAASPFVVVDCGALVPTLVEAELFGHERGAFTGAVEARAGAFERANGGTVFLDEIGELPLSIQPKLLRALESREVRRVGANRPVAIDVRVLAATHRALAAEVNRGSFRSDLYYRLAVVEVTMPPLRERLADVPLLVARILEDLGRDPREVSQATLSDLMAYAWPGNVRELRNFVERAVAMDEAPPPGDLAVAGEGPPIVDHRLPFGEAKQKIVESFERSYVEILLAAHGGNVSAAARAARMDRMHLYKLAERYGVFREGRRRR
jgi:DNA-binding NtrC family response regulator